MPLSGPVQRSNHKNWHHLHQQVTNLDFKASVGTYVGVSWGDLCIFCNWCCSALPKDDHPETLPSALQKESTFQNQVKGDNKLERKADYGNTGLPESDLSALSTLWAKAQDLLILVIQAQIELHWAQFSRLEVST